jgi:hypothetical protein
MRREAHSTKPNAAFSIRETHCIHKTAQGASRTLLSGAVEGTRGNAGVVRIGLSVTGKINPIITCCQSYVAYVPFKVARVCYPEPWNRS